MRRIFTIKKIIGVVLTVTLFLSVLSAAADGSPLRFSLSKTDADGFYKIKNGLHFPVRTVFVRRRISAGEGTE